MTKEQAVERLNKIITTKFNNDYSIDNVDKEAIEIVLSMLEEKDKIIDKMAEVICRLDTMNNYDTWNNDIQEVKQYFENKAKEV